MLENLQENVLFHAAIRAHSVLLRARYTNEGKANEFLQGGDGSRALRGKIKSNQAILTRFIDYLQTGRFEISKRFTQEAI